MATTPKPDPQPKLRQEPGDFSQKFSDTGYRRKYGTGRGATIARIQAIFKNRGLTPSAGRLRELYSRRSDEFAKGFDALRADVADLPGAKAKATEGKHLDLPEIRQALDAITREFTLQRAGLQGQRDSTKRGFKLLDQRMRGERADALTGLRSGAAGRGLLRSGLYLQDVGEVGEEFSAARSTAIAERDARLREFANQLAQLRSGEMSARATKARELARAQVGPKGDIARALQLV